MKTIFFALTFLFAWTVLGQAPELVATPVAAAAPVAKAGIIAWIDAHGGFQASILLLVGSAMAILSAVRTVLSNFDGVAPGASIPPGLTGLTMINKICVVLGKVIDFVQGNVQH